MSYYIAITLHSPFDQVIERAEEALKSQGFGIISRIDIKETLKAKIGVDFHSYTILGACNPQLAYEALKIEDKVGTMLPCNVVVQARGPKETEVAAIDPVASMRAIENPELQQAAGEIRRRLESAIRSLESAVQPA